MVVHMRMKRWVAIALLGVFWVGGPAGAAPAASGVGSPAGTMIVDYVGVARGLTVMALRARYTMRPDGYDAQLAFRTAGMFGLFLHANNVTTVSGQFLGDVVRPAQLDSRGRMRGVDRITKMIYQHGDPVVETLVPDLLDERTKVPPELMPGTVDNVSASLLLLHEVATYGACNGGVRSFDGRRVADLKAHFAGWDVMAPNRRTIFAGKAMRCDFTSAQLAGFVKNQPEAELRKPKPGTIWVAALVPGGVPVPVRVDFENHNAGQVSLFLTAVTPGGDPCCGGDEISPP